jgi:hypothetical protein
MAPYYTPEAVITTGFARSGFCISFCIKVQGAVCPIAHTMLGIGLIQIEQIADCPALSDPLVRSQMLL